MASAINPLNPTAGQATTQSVRENFAAAKSEIETLQVENTALESAVYWQSSQGKKRAKGATGTFSAFGAQLSGALTTTAILAGRIYFFPFLAIDLSRVTTLAAKITTASAGTIELGIYASADLVDELCPGLLLVKTSKMSSSALGVVQESIAPMSGHQGEMLWAAVSVSANTSITALNTYSTENHLGYLGSGSTPISHVSSITFTELPSDASTAALSISAAAVPAIGWLL